MGLTKAAINRPVFMLMLIVAALLLGTIAWKTMNIEQTPNINFGIVTITTNYPGASAEEMETLITRPIENAAAGVSGIRQIDSSSLESYSQVMIQFELDVNIDRALDDVRSNVDAIVNTLPKDLTNKPVVNKINTSGAPILYYAFSSQKMTAEQLRDLADNTLSQYFQQINGVAAVSVTGGDVREIQVRATREKMLAYQIGVSDILNAIMSTNQNIPSGFYITNGQQFNVRFVGQYEHLRQIFNTKIPKTNPVNPLSHPRVVNLSDIAEIEDTTAERINASRLDGKDAVVLSILKTVDGNTVNISQASAALVKQLEKDYGLKIVKTYDDAFIILSNLTDLNIAIIFGVFLVAAVVFVFLHNMRGTFIVSLAIPTTIFAAFAIIGAVGFTINDLTMMAVSLAVAVLVDDAIVVLENIYRHLKLGEDPVSAAINGRAEIGLAAIAITMCDVVVFVPVGLMGGLVGQFFMSMAFTYVIVVLLSLFVSFTITPMLASRWYRAGEDFEHPKGRFAAAFERGFDRLEHFYKRVLNWSLNHRWFIFITGFAVLIFIFEMIAASFAPTFWDAIKTSFGLVKISLIIALLVFVINMFRGYFKLRFLLYGAGYAGFFIFAAIAGYGYALYKEAPIFKFAFLPNSDSGQVTVSIEASPRNDLHTTEELVKKIEKMVAKHPDVRYILSSVGFSGGGTFSAANQGPYLAQVTAFLYEKSALLNEMISWVTFSPPKEKERHKSDILVAAEILAMVNRMPGALIKVAAPEAIGEGGSAIQMDFVSLKDNRADIEKVINKVMPKLKEGVVPGLINVDQSSKLGTPEIHVIPDTNRLSDFGFNANTLGQALTVLYEGNNNSLFRSPISGNEYGIRVMLDYKDRNNPDTLNQMPFAFMQGRPVYMSSVSTIKEVQGVNQLDRLNRKAQIQITGDLLPGYAAGSVQAGITNWIDKEKVLPPDVEMVPMGQADQQKRDGPRMVKALFLGLILVYMVLASLYNNLIYPFIIQFAQPQAMVGAILAIVLTDHTFSVVSFIGLITLVGLVGKNGILLVDYANTLRERGRNRHDALVESGQTRLRPILMTTLALVFGMLPIALAIGRGSEFRATIGIVIIGGMILATVLTLVVIPCSYTIFDDISIKIGQLIRKYFFRNTEPPAPQSV